MQEIHTGRKAAPPELSPQNIHLTFPAVYSCRYTKGTGAQGAHHTMPRDMTKRIINHHKVTRTCSMSEQYCS